MGELLIPKISVDLPIMHGASGCARNMLRVILPATSLPVGGRSTRAVITGHSNLRGATLFTWLRELDEGTRSISRSWATRSAYRVNDIRNCQPLTDTKALKIRKGRDEVTLLTCTWAGQHAPSPRHRGTQQHARPGPIARRCAELGYQNRRSSSR